MNSYRLKKENNRLVFSTQSFRAEKSSVLHEGVYTKEFASMLTASALSVPVYIAVSFFADTLALRILSVIILFVLSFLAAKKYVFREDFLEAIFDRASKTVFIKQSGFLSVRKETIPFEDIGSVEIGSRTFDPVNLDGIQFVQKISAQHGSAVPGLSESEEFVTLLLKENDGTEHTIFAGRIKDEPEIPLNEIKKVLDITNA
jgi:hypothetical protein